MTVPSLSAVNFMPSSTCAASVTETVCGVAVSSHTLHGHTPAWAGAFWVRNAQVTAEPIVLPETSFTPDTEAV